LTKNQIGGGYNDEKIVPQYVFNESKNRDKEAVNRSKITEQNTKPVLKKQEPVANQFVPVIGIDNPYRLEIPNYYVPIVNQNTINVSNPLTAHPLEIVSNIYEDYIIPNLYTKESTTIESRMNIYNIIRNTVMNKADGREIYLASRNESSILSYVKLLEANPYHHMKNTNNPYRSNPFNMVVLRAGYPIRFMENGIATSLGNNSVSMNLRIYNLNNGEYYFPKIPFLKELDLNPWRELLAYTYILRNIVESKVSPNFVVHYGYFMNRNKIQFETINKLRNDNFRLVANRRAINEKYERLIIQAKNNMNNKSYVIATGTDGTKYSGVGIALIDSNNNMLLVRNPDQPDEFEDLGGKLSYSLKRSAIDIAKRKSNGVLSISEEMLNDKLYIDIDHRGDYKYRVYLIKTNILPDIPNSLKVNIRTELPSNRTYHERLPQIINKLRLPEYFNKLISAPITRINPLRIIRDPPKETIYQVDSDFLSRDSKVCLLILTESPTQSIYQWTSREYDSNFTSVRRMEKLGIHTDSEWENVIFQILFGMYVMQKYRICYYKMSLEKNVFIKDLPSLSNQYWIYTIDGIDYYLPNLGYLVMFDIGGIEEDNNISKITIGSWNEDPDIDNKIFDNFRRIMSENNFVNNTLPFLTNMPSNNIIKIFNDITREINRLQAEKDASGDNYQIPIGKIIHQFMNKFLHPRLGQLLTPEESNSLSDTDKDFEQGELVAYKDITKGIRDDIWVIFEDDNIVDGVYTSSTVLWYDHYSNTNKNEQVNKYNTLRKYFSHKNIEMNPTRLTDFAYSNLLERYSL
jgi:hypothetical protein